MNPRTTLREYRGENPDFTPQRTSSPDGLKEMPPGAIQADLTQHRAHGSYSPPMWYADELAKGKAMEKTLRKA